MPSPFAQAASAGLERREEETEGLASERGDAGDVEAQQATRAERQWTDEEWRAESKLKIQHTDHEDVGWKRPSWIYSWKKDLIFSWPIRCPHPTIEV